LYSWVWQLTDLDRRESRRPGVLSDEGPASLNGTGPPQFRAGGKVLSLFSSTLHGVILRALAEGPVPMADLRAKAQAPSEKALRGNIGNLIGIGALGKRRPDGATDLLDNELTPFGRELVHVSVVIEQWLGGAPNGPVDPESETARGTVRALVAGWNSTMLRALAARALSLAELNDLIAAFSYPALERRLVAMRDGGLLLAGADGDGARASYAPTDWLREATAPLLAAIRCERKYPQAGAAPLGRLDVETLLLLAIPLLGPLGDSEGDCRLAVDLGEGARSGRAGVTVTVREGGVVSCSSALDGDPLAAASGAADGWLEAIVAGDANGLRIDGDNGLPSALVDGLHRRLYVDEVPSG